MPHTRSGRRGSLMLSVLLALGLGTASPATAAPAETQPSLEEQVIALSNQERAAHGCGPLTLDDTLASAALAHSQDMAARNYFSHTSADGRSPGDRISEAGYRWTSWAENLAGGQQTPEEVVDAWMSSTGHRRNLLNCALEEVGIGIAENSRSRYKIYWTQDFGTPS